MERSRRTAPLSVLLVSTALLMVGCLPSRALPVARIGAALSLTGPARLIGMAQRSGIKLAQDEINASHALGKTRLEVLIADDASDREQAAGVFQSFIEDSHVLAIMG